MDYNLTTHFKAKELACKCGCNVNSMEHEFMGMLEELRVKLGRPVYITSGFRCPQHNKAVGGSTQSYHLKGRASDIVCSNAAERYEVVGAAIKIGFSGIGIDKGFVHVDNRNSQPRKIWIY